jgi:hypothetical protein
VSSWDGDEDDGDEEQDIDDNDVDDDDNMMYGMKHQRRDD